MTSETDSEPKTEPKTRRKFIEKVKIPEQWTLTITKEDLLLYLIALYVRSTLRWSIIQCASRLIPPISVYAKRQFSSAFWINLALWLILYLPAVVHAWYIISCGLDDGDRESRWRWRYRWKNRRLERRYSI
ncbi:hypothetical protein BDN72DRAFT_333888 [Pluteus cervinus]|uniref:Uncharacterized protein n=1 Tax=Pluteus cervinus TaxID=181527 RepID=A0ACD3B216_9AGAR|nr:hypothetical protein BDN72DRAFT_333888 [Pluteus cervinus]